LPPGGQPHQLRGLVEGLARGVVTGLSQQAVPAPRLDVHEQRVPTRDEQRGEGRRRVAMFEGGREEMPFHVMHADHRLAERLGERLRVAHADEQRAHESRCVRHRDRVDLVEGAPRLRERPARHGNDRRQVLS
jgi:hypothetical protein